MHHLVVSHHLRLEVYSWKYPKHLIDLIYKLQSLGTFDNPQTHIERFLRNRFQRVVLTGPSSSCSRGLTDVHQESVLEPQQVVSVY